MLHKDHFSVPYKQGDLLFLTSQTFLLDAFASIAQDLLTFTNQVHVLTSLTSGMLIDSRSEKMRNDESV